MRGLSLITLEKNIKGLDRGLSLIEKNIKGLDRHQLDREEHKGFR
jgi:hypothetical protein